LTDCADLIGCNIWSGARLELIRFEARRAPMTVAAETAQKRVEQRFSAAFGFLLKARGFSR
jgi:hypothetical protein